MGLDSAFVKQVQDTVHPNTTYTKVYNRTVAATGSVLTDYIDPDAAQPATLKMTTLQGVVDYVLGGIADEKVIVHIVSPTQIDVTAPLVGDRRNKLVYLTATPLLPEIKFEQYIDLEGFIISLQSAFADTPSRKAVQDIAGKVKAGLAAEIKDDGISQTFTSTKGITRTEGTEVQNPYVLQPYRTFAEVAQPASPFILRLKQLNAQSDALVAGAALFLADGGAWRSVAIAAIGEWLNEGINNTVDLTERVTILA